jgi:hypothetical protein
VKDHILKTNHDIDCLTKHTLMPPTDQYSFSPVQTQAEHPVSPLSGIVLIASPLSLQDRASDVPGVTDDLYDLSFREEAEYGFHSKEMVWRFVDPSFSPRLINEGRHDHRQDAPIGAVTAVQRGTDCLRIEIEFPEELGWKEIVQQSIQVSVERKIAILTVIEAKELRLAERAIDVRMGSQDIAHKRRPTAGLTHHEDWPIQHQ